MNTDKLKFHPGVFFTPFLFILTMWLVAYANWKLVLDYVEYGIFPREIWGLKGILFSPFIHGDISHITNNSIALIVLLSMVAFFYRKNYLTVIILGWLLSGLLTWLIGRPSFHIGASGLVYVLTAYLFFSGLKTKYYRLMAASLVVVMLYGGSVWYMFPNRKSTRLNSSHVRISYAVFCLKKQSRLDSLRYKSSKIISTTQLTTRSRHNTSPKTIAIT